MNKRNLSDYFLLSARGMAMGAADVIPGVSGGTIAFITGIYEELINSIKSVNKTFFELLFKKGISAAWQHVNGNFLIAVLGGILFSIFSLAKLISWLLENHPMIVWAFFFGLIVASALHVGRKITNWNITNIVTLIVGVAIAAYITIATPASTPETWWYIFLSGTIAITAMILPGISGSFILLLLGKYEFILNAVKDFQIAIIAIFASGCLVGIISFSNVISWFFKKLPNTTMALLTGFMLGSLNKLWPWKEVTATRINSAGLEVPFLEKSISPFRYSLNTGESNQLIWIISFALMGFLVIFLFDFFVARNQKTDKQADQNY
jgi:putative membrane protein